MVPKAVITMTGVCEFCRRMAASNSRPSICGRRKSVRTRSARSAIFRRFFGRARLVDFEARRDQLQLDDAAELLFVLDHQDASLHWELAVFHLSAA